MSDQHQPTAAPDTSAKGLHTVAVKPGALLYVGANYMYTIDRPFLFGGYIAFAAAGLRMAMWAIR